MCKGNGEAGKRLHTGRSRNDQVALDCRMYAKLPASRWSKEMLEWKSSTSPSVALLKRPPQSFIAFLLMRGQVNRPREKFRFKSIVPCFPAHVKSRACIFCALIATLNAVSLTFS